MDKQWEDEHVLDMIYEDIYEIKNRYVYDEKKRVYRHKVSKDIVSKFELAGVCFMVIVKLGTPFSVGYYNYFDNIFKSYNDYFKD